MCEIVRFKPRAPGEFYISILDYDTLSHRWQTWAGIAYVLAEKAATKIGVLQKTVFPGEAVPPKPKELESPNSPKMLEIPTDGERFQHCPVCEQKVLKKNLQKHIRRIHNGSLTPLNVPPSKKKKRRKGTPTPEGIPVTVRQR